jgi:hypothetical protein
LAAFRLTTGEESKLKVKVKFSLYDEVLSGYQPGQMVER